MVSQTHTHTHTHTYTLGLKHSISGLSAEVNCFWEVWANSAHLVSLRRVWKKSLFFSGRKKITQYTHTHTHTHHLGSFKVRLTHTWVGNFVQIGNLMGQPLIWCLQASTEQACAVSVSCGSAEPRPGDCWSRREKNHDRLLCAGYSAKHLSYLVLTDTGTTLRAKCYQKDHFTDEKTKAYITFSNSCPKS